MRAHNIQACVALRDQHITQSLADSCQPNSMETSLSLPNISSPDLSWRLLTWIDSYIAGRHGAARHGNHTLFVVRVPFIAAAASVWPRLLKA